MSNLIEQITAEALDHLEHTYRFWVEAKNASDAEREVGRLKLQLIGQARKAGAGPRELKTRYLVGSYNTSGVDGHKYRVWWDGSMWNLNQPLAARYASKAIALNVVQDLNEAAEEAALKARPPGTWAPAEVQMVEE